MKLQTSTAISIGALLLSLAAAGQAQQASVTFVPSAGGTKVPPLRVEAVPVVAAAGTSFSAGGTKVTEAC
ncbi:MAG: hypothetical protein AAFY11_05555 [Cyanobacteria bacterium J06641_5]